MFWRTVQGVKYIMIVSKTEVGKHPNTPGYNQELFSNITLSQVSSVNLVCNSRVTPNVFWWLYLGTAHYIVPNEKFSLSPGLILEHVLSL